MASLDNATKIKNNKFIGMLWATLYATVVISLINQLRKIPLQMCRNIKTSFNYVINIPLNIVLTLNKYAYYVFHVHFIYDIIM